MKWEVKQLMVLMLTGLPALESKIESLLSLENGIDEFLALESFYEYESYKEAAYSTVIVNRYMDQSDEGSELIKFIKQIRYNNKDIHVIALLAENEPGLVQALVSVGVFDIIISDPNEMLESLANRICKAVQLPARQYDFNDFYQSQVKINKGIEQHSKADFSLKIARKVVIESVFKQVIAFYSPTNSGATTTALNLGIALTESKKCKVLAMGLDMMNPKIASMLKKQPDKTIYQLINAFNKRLPLCDLIDDVVVKVGKLDVLPSCFDYNEYYYLAEDDLRKLIHGLQKHYDYVLLDLNSYLTDKSTFLALNEAHRVYFISEPNKQALRVSMDYKKLILDKIPQCHISGIIVNQFGGMCLTSVEIEDLIGKPPVAYISEHKAIRRGGDGILYRKKISRLYKEMVKEVLR